MRLLFLFIVLVSNIVFGQSIPPLTDPIDSIFKSKFPKVYGEIGHPYPDFEIKRENRTINSKTIQGKVVLINFWFKACLPCMAEMEGLNTLYKKLANNKDFIFLSIAKDNKENIRNVIRKYNLAFAVYSLSENECKRLNFGSGYPTSIILDKTGVIKNIHVGGITDKDGASERVMYTLLPEIQSLLGN
ncbi:MAG TPA: redoxin domain-containing protein [Flavisolibacter sp.]|nr:redoxin domain-containing protein [Flavisolibacter sp.]